MTTTIPFMAYEISGLGFPPLSGFYNSAAVNYRYVATLSSNIDSRIDALGGFNQTNYITSTNSIARFYPSAAGHFYTGSGSKLSDLYNWMKNSGTAINAVVRSGNEYSQAYKSAQLSKPHAYQAKISSQYMAGDTGWVAVTTGSKYVTYTSTLPSKPKIMLQPSGIATYGFIVTNILTTGFTVSITAAGNRCLFYEAII